MIWDLFLSRQVSRNQIGGKIWTYLRKLFTITFQLRTGLGDLDDCTVVEKGPQPFVLNVLMLDCSEGSINGWHMLSISWECTPVACTTCAIAALEKQALMLMNRKALLMSPTQSGTRTRHCPLTIWAYKGKDTGTVRNRRGCLAVLRNILVSGRLTGWLAETIWGFLRSKACLAHRFLMGEQLEVPLSLDCLFLPQGPWQW